MPDYVLALLDRSIACTYVRAKTTSLCASISYVHDHHDDGKLPPAVLLRQSIIIDAIMHAWEADSKLLTTRSSAQK